MVKLIVKTEAPVPIFCVFSAFDRADSRARGRPSSQLSFIWLGWASQGHNDTQVYRCPTRGGRRVFLSFTLVITRSIDWRPRRPRATLCRVGPLCPVVEGDWTTLSHHQLYLGPPNSFSVQGFNQSLSGSPRWERTCEVPKPTKGIFSPLGKVTCSMVVLGCTPCPRRNRRVDDQAMNTDPQTPLPLGW